MSVNYSIKISMHPLHDALQAIAKRTDGKGLSQAVLSGLFQLEAEAKLNVRANFKQRTGNLAGNWETKIDEVTNHSAQGHTGPLAVYARIQELGGVIRATRAGALSFQTDDGQWRRVKAVTIPARPYLRTAADTHKDNIIAAVGNILNQLIEGGL